ncbi:LLM class flavin-dependent oxidoreductase [Jatrophihabitans sp. YIM 134969]
MDHGHTLHFGAFLTPAAADPHGVVARAQLAEQVGLDLVTFQDHPYQPAFLETWTLLSVVAASTERITVAPNVVNLPLRPPAVLARSVASLDLLSDGRVELGLGAGAFWDPIVAMGGKRLTAGEAVRALDEAVQVLRQAWDTGERGGVRVDGEFHRVLGAKRGPAPAHPVEIWFGAYKPKMLALTGRVADGWLPSLGYLDPADFAASNATIDDAARAAGREPGAIRRLLNVTGDVDPADLARWTLEHGFSTYILGTDDPDAIRRFAGETATTVRELVAAGRSGAAVVSTPVPEAPRRETVVARGGFAVTPTPDDGTRRSSVRPWDESQRPTGPAPDPDRTYTAHDLASAQQLVDVHDHLRSELAQLYDLVDQVADGELPIGAARSQINAMTMRQNNWTLGTYCESYCRLVTMHHSLEDQAMLPRLAQGDPRLAPVTTRLQQEHVVIHDVLEGLDQALVALVSQPDGIPALRDALDLLSDTLLSHLSYEERELVEPLARLGMF